MYKYLLFTVLAFVVSATTFNVQAEEKKNADKPEIPPQTIKAVLDRQKELNLMYWRIRHEYPDQAAELEKLRKEKPDEFTATVEKMAKELADKQDAEREEFTKLVKDYQKKRDPKILEQIKAKLTGKLEHSLTRDQIRIKNMEARLAAMQQSLDKLKARYQKRSSNKNVMIDNKLRQFCSDPDLKW